VVIGLLRWSWARGTPPHPGDGHEGVLQRGLLGGQLEQRDPGRPGDAADLVGAQPGHGQGPVGARRDGHRWGAEPGGQLLRIGAADPHDAAPGPGDEVGHAGVGDQPAPADDDEVLSGQGHLVHQVGGDEHRPALGGEVPQQGPDPADALGVEAVERLVEDDRAGVAQQGGGDAEALAHAE
jgi:hypothetical protein